MFEDKYKPYQKHSETTVNKTKWRESQWHQPELPFNGRSKEQYYAYVSRKRYLTIEEVTELFWNGLVQVGWRWDENKEGKVYLVLVCDKCDTQIFSAQLETIGQTDSTDISIMKDPAGLKAKHKALCKALPEEGGNE